MRKLKEKEFDVVLCDIKMPKVDGLEVLDRVIDGAADAPIVMRSGHGDSETGV